MLHQMLLSAQHFITSYFHTHPYASIVITLLIALIESLPVLGTIVPGSVMMTAIGALIGSGLVAGVPTIIAATLGAFIGDCIGFALGVRYKNNYRNMWPFKKYPVWMDKSEAFFAKHGGKSIIVGRFIGPARSTVPMVAGLLKVSWPRFVMAAVPSAFMWALAYMLPGILLGAFALEIPVKQMPQFIIYGIILIALIWFIIWLCQRSFSFLSSCVCSFMDRRWQSIQIRNNSYSISSFIANKNNPSDSKQALLLVLSLFLFFIFILLLILVMTKSFIINLNNPIYYLLQSLRTQPVDKFFIGLTSLCNTDTVIVSSLFIMIGLFIMRQFRLLGFFFISMAMAAVLGNGVKMLFFSLRPEVVLPYIHESSFPSGHALISVTFYGSIAYISTQLFTNVSRRFIYGLVSVIVFIIILSRLYLGAHWLTDVIAGVILGVAVVLFCVMLYRRNAKLILSSHDIKYWIITIVFSLLFVPAGYISWRYNATTALYSPTIKQETLSSSSWWQQPLSGLPIARMNRFGRLVQPFNIQISASLSNINQVLVSNGWKVISTADNTDTASDPDLPLHMQHKRIFPLLYKDHPPVLTAIKQAGNGSGFIEINLWNSFVSLTDPAGPLWLGSISYTKKTHKLLWQDGSSVVFLSGYDHFFSNVLSFYDAQRIEVPSSLITHRLQDLNWSGSIIILKSLPKLGE